VACASAEHTVDGLRTRLSDHANGGISRCRSGFCSVWAVKKPSVLPVIVRKCVVLRYQPKSFPSCILLVLDMRPYLRSNREQYLRNEWRRILCLVTS
jgi:hypothetical protein